MSEYRAGRVFSIEHNEQTDTYTVLHNGTCIGTSEGPGAATEMAIRTDQRLTESEMSYRYNKGRMAIMDDLDRLVQQVAGRVALNRSGDRETISVLRTIHEYITERGQEIETIAQRAANQIERMGGEI